MEFFIALLACNASAPQTQCVPFYGEVRQFDSVEDCAEYLEDAAEAFASRAPATTVIRGGCKLIQEDMV